MSIGRPASLAARCGDTGRSRRTPAARTSCGPQRRQPRHFGRVVVLLDAGLNRLPVFERKLTAIAVEQGGGGDGLADPGVGAGYEEAAEHGTDSRSATDSAPANRSRISSVRSALTEIRRRAVPGATLGGRMARTSKPCACSCAGHEQRAIVVAEHDRDDLRGAVRHRHAARHGAPREDTGRGWPAARAAPAPARRSRGWHRARRPPTAAAPSRR